MGGPRKGAERALSNGRIDVTHFAKVLFAVALLALPAAAQTPRTIIVMDGSGSMWGQIEGRPKLEIARETVGSVLGTIPADQEVGLMAYGHRDRGNCSDIELMVSPAAGTGAEIAARVNEMRFQGKTPLSEAVRQAAEALRFGVEAATVVLVTDGLETCEADPCALGRDLEAAGLNFTAHVIGFGLTGAEGAQVACLATETGGQYLQASDAGGLAAALSATVRAELPPPQPLPEPEPDPVLPRASLTAPESAPAGSVLRVAFEGPHEEFDYIRVLDANGDWQAEAAVGEEPFVDLRLPFDLGAYELVYLFKATEIIARQPLQITEAVVSLTAPESAPRGFTILVEWTGPGAGDDYINLRDAAGERVAEARVRDTSPLELDLPWATGDFTLTYVFQNQDVIFSRPITLTEAPVSITAPDMAQVGTEVTITWVGPGAAYDNIQLISAESGDRFGYEYTKDRDSMVWTMPEEPGIYEFHYKFRDSEVILTRPITVTLDKVEATPTTPDLTPDMQVPVTFAADMGSMGFEVQWSAVPVPGQDLPPEAWAMPDATSDPVEAMFFPGDYDVTGVVVAGDDTFGGRVTVVAGQENRFLLPLISTGTAGEDPPSGDVMAVTIEAEGYEGLVEWSAMPEGGGPDDRLADTVAGGWQTTLTPGDWAFFGMAQEGTFFGRVTVAAGQSTYVIPREGPVEPAAEASDDVGFRCDGPAACPISDPETGLGFVLPAGWFTDFPFFYETAAGVVADRPTMAFLTAEGGRIELNPIQWVAANGPCRETAAGALCHWADASPEVITAHGEIAASLTFGPRAGGAAAPGGTIPGIKLDLTPEAAEALRAKLRGEK